ncbi:S41 family peptidase [Thalassotalea ganghwensis]
MFKWLTPLLLVLLVVLGISSIGYAQENPQGIAISEKPLPLIPAKEATSVYTTLINAFKHIYVYPLDVTELVAELDNIVKLKGITDDVPYELFARDLHTSVLKATQDSHIAIQLTNTIIEAQASDNTVNVEFNGDGIFYLKVNGALTEAISNNLLAETLADLSQAKAVILDLQQADSVSLATVEHLFSFFIADGVTLGELTLNDTVKTVVVNGSSLLKPLPKGTPVYLVTSAFVSREWEFFTHVLKEHLNATIIGQETMGMTHLTTTLTLSPHLSLTLPYAKISCIQSKHSWQGIGITPDFYADSDTSLEKALHLLHVELNAAQ